LLWVVAGLVAAAALVAGCLQVSVPEGPYVVAGNANTAKIASPQEQQRVSTMDRKSLEDSVLRLTAQNDSLRTQVEELKRDNKLLKGERNRLKDDVDNLRDQLKDRR
jgi:peptidoglycan hydrolase CwlO-like protein